MSEPTSPLINGSPATPFALDAAAASAAAAGTRLERRLEAWSEWLNPILVKEARQAFKSNQFLITFLLLLLFAWGWSILGVVMQMPGVQFGSGGAVLLGGYYLILALPLLVIVPFTSFRSLAAEREDGTFEILSITTLSARQIVVGKLGSAILQMMVYFSALSPCIAFTYLLRGIDVVTIVVVLFYTFVVSLCLCCFSLLVATLTRARHWQVLLSVALVLGLFLVAWSWSMAVLAGFLDSAGSLPVHAPEFWPVQWTIISGALAFCVLCISAARGLISFASDNRSTPLRRIMLGHQALFLFWVVYWLITVPDEEFLMVMAAFAGIYWMVAGTLMIGESAQLSPRVRRRLPQSLLGRMLFTWFNPGSGTGYAFAVVNFGVVVCFFLGAGFLVNLTGGGRFNITSQWIMFTTLGWAYVALYLGVTRTALLLLNRWVRPNMVLSTCLAILFLLVGCAAPFLFESALSGFQQIDYTPLQFTNWWWTLYEAGDRDIWTTPLVPPLVFLSALLFIGLQFFTMGDELFVSRASIPTRVAEDDERLHPTASAEAERSGPWD